MRVPYLHRHHPQSLNWLSGKHSVIHHWLCNNLVCCCFVSILHLRRSKNLTSGWIMNIHLGGRREEKQSRENLLYHHRRRRRRRQYYLIWSKGMCGCRSIFARYFFVFSSAQFLASSPYLVLPIIISEQTSMKPPTQWRHSHTHPSKQSRMQYLHLFRNRSFWHFLCEEKRVALRPRNNPSLIGNES